MTKKLVLTFAILVSAIGLQSIAAETTIFNEAQKSPIYTDDIGRTHFMGRGGYSEVRKMQMGGAQADLVNDAVNKFSDKEKVNNEESKAEAAEEASEAEVTTVSNEEPAAEEKTVNNEEPAVEETAVSNEKPAVEEKTALPSDITDVIKEKPVLPASSHHHKSTYSYEKGGIDPSNPYGFAGTTIPSGVNESKTIYKDDLGRLHFFGKANRIEETKTEVAAPAEDE